MPPMDINLIEQMGRELHPAHLHSSNGLMAEDEVCPWTLFLTMALTLLKGVMPHVPKMLPVLIPDPEVRRRATETFQSDEFKDNIEEYFVENIKTDIQAPLNRQILKSSETVMYAVDLMNTMVAAFTGEVANAEQENDIGKTDNRPRSNSMGSLGNILKFASTLSGLLRK